MTGKPRVNGTRICRRCRGLCHENAWRDKIGQRKGYWCGDECLKADVGEFYWANFRDDNYEQVDVITK